MFTSYAGPATSVKPVPVYLACDPAIQVNNKEDLLAQYIRGEVDSSALDLTGAQPVMMIPLTARGIDAVRKAASARAPDSYLGSMVDARIKSDSGLKDAIAADFASLNECTNGEGFQDLSKKAMAAFLGALTDLEREAYEAHHKHLEAVGEEMAFASLVSFPFTGPDGEPITPKNKEDLRLRVESIQPLPMARRVIVELINHAHRLTFLGEEKKG